jgi:sulfur-oxidizing protein SoxX
MTTVLRLLAVAAAVSAGAASGAATTGRQIFLQRDLGNCIACHQVSDAASPAVRANVGPRLDAVRLKGWNRDRLRGLLADPTRDYPDTVMPPYGRHRLLDAGEIERVIDYLHALP